MESSNGNYMNGMAVEYNRTLGPGAITEIDCSPDEENRYQCIEEMDRVIRELDNVERICQQLIKKYDGVDGPGTSQSDISQCSIDNDSTMCPPVRNVEKPAEDKKKTTKGKYVLPADYIDLTSEDSCDSNISRRVAQEPVDFDQVQSPLAAGSVAAAAEIDRSPGLPDSNLVFSLANPSPLTVKGPQEPTILSEDEEQEVNYQPYEWGGNSIPQEKKDDLEDVWKEMARAMTAQGTTPVPLALLPKVRNRGKKRKVNDIRPLGAREGPVEHPSIQLASQANELVPVEPSPKIKKHRGRPKKTGGFTGEMVSPRVDTLVSPAGKGAKEKVRKEDGKGEPELLKLKGKEREIDMKKIQDAYYADDEEECKHNRNPPPDIVAELRILSSKMNGEKVDYEPYIRKPQKEVQEETDEELQSLFDERKIALASTQGPNVDDERGAKSNEVMGCEHKAWDYDEDMGYYCEDCGAEGIDMPAPSKVCLHKHIEFKDEVGYYCEDCGHVGRDIQSLYLVSQKLKEQRKASQEDPLDKKDEVIEEEDLPECNLKLHDLSTEEFRGAELQRHPLFEEKMHPHQKKGFEFLIENLLGGEKGSNDSVGCVLAHAPGTGKTFLTISFIQSFLARYSSGRPLILAPKMILNSWLKEFENWKVEEIPIYNLSDCSVVGEGFSDENDEEEDESTLSPSVRKTLKESRGRVLTEWQVGRGVLLMSYPLFSLLVTRGLSEATQKGSLDYHIGKILVDAPNLVVLDEGHLARNIKTRISQALLAMSTRRRVLLSGTLFQNNFKELYTLLKLCRDDFMMRHPVYGKKISEVCASASRSRSSGLAALAFVERKSKKELMQVEEKIFQEEIGEKLERYVKSGDSKTEEIKCVVEKLQSLTASFVNWYPGEILKSLPGLFEYSVHLNLTQAQLDKISKLPTERYHMTKQHNLLAACIHPSLTHRTDDAITPFQELVAAPTSSLDDEAFKGVKIVFLLQLLARCQAAQEKLLIFCSTLSPLKYIGDLFCKKWEWTMGQQILRLDGTMQDSDRQRVIEQFNNKDVKTHVLLASTKACKEGITLVGASRVVIIDNPDNPAIVRQAVSRAFRIGQKRKVFVYRLVTINHEEEELFRRSVNKERLSQVLLDPVSTLARIGGFLQELSASQVEDELLRRMMNDDARKGRYINMIHRYNAAGPV